MTKLYIYLAGLAAVAGVLGGVYWSGYSSGRESFEAEAAVKIEELREDQRRKADLIAKLRSEDNANVDEKIKYIKTTGAADKCVRAPYPDYIRERLQ